MILLCLIGDYLVEWFRSDTSLRRIMDMILAGTVAIAIMSAAAPQSTRPMLAVEMMGAAAI